MAATVTDEQWKAVRESLRTATERFGDLVSSAPDPAIRATDKWTVADVAAHVVGVAWLDTTMLGAAPDPFPMPDVAQAIDATRVDDVHGFNDQILGYLTERDPKQLTDMLRRQVDVLLTYTQDRDPAETVVWLAGARPTLAGLLAHLVNELLQHGYDVARAVKVPWAIPPRDAAAFFELFYMGLASGEAGRILDGSKRPLDRRIAVQFRSAYTTPVTVVVRNGRATAEPAGPGADITIRFEPAEFMMMMFGRVSKARAVLTRKVVVSGPRPWLLPAFLRTVRAPSS